MQQGDQEFRSNNLLTEQIIGACIEVHRTLGPGLLESVYEECLCRELELRKLGFRRQVPIGVDYKGAKVEWAYRIDVLVEEQVVVELKSIEHLQPLHQAQVLTYLKIGRYPWAFS